MGATLRYAKVVDRDHLQEHGGLSPDTDNVVVVAGEPPAPARVFLVLRAWDDVEAGFEETWRMEDPHGRVVHEGIPRTVLATHGDIADEVQGVHVEYAAPDYQVVLHVDGREVARVDVDVVADPDARAVPPPTTEAAAADADAATADDESQVVPLTGEEERVLAAVARLESDGAAAFAQDIAEAAGMDDDATRRVLSRLTGEADLVQEVPTGAGDDPDLGPRYSVKSRP